MEVVVREFAPGDGGGVAALILENAAYHARLAPDYFKLPDQDGLVAFIESDEEWRAAESNLALVAQVHGQVAGCLEASVQPPHETARWQAQRDLEQPRLHINFLGTADAFKRQGVATRLVEEAERWGRSKGAIVAVCDTYIDSPLSVPFWEQRMGYSRRAIILRKPLEPPSVEILGIPAPKRHASEPSHPRRGAQPPPSTEAGLPPPGATSRDVACDVSVY